MPEIRRYRPSDRPVLYDICVRTADSGADVRGRYSTDDLMGDLFCGPYLQLDPQLASVVDAGTGVGGGGGADAGTGDGAGRAVGYVIGTADTAGFVERYRDEWLPGFASRYPEPPPAPRTPEQDMVALGYWPERMVLPELAGYPAHLHIDLLPEYQGKGLGRRLIDQFLADAAAAGAPGVHLCMLTANVAARAFYDRLGFHVIDVPDPGPVIYLGRSTAAPSGPHR